MSGCSGLDVDRGEDVDHGRRGGTERGRSGTGVGTKRDERSTLGEENEKEKEKG